MAMGLLKIFGTRDYYFTTHMTNEYSLKMNVFFYLKIEEDENFATWFSDL